MSCRLLRRVLTLLLLVTGIWCALPSPAGGAASWIAPLPEPLTVTRAFDPPDNPYGAGHRGVDLAGIPGQEVRAAGAGTVVYAGPLAGRGVVSVQHADGLRTTYEPVLASVAAGVAVSLGQVIGTLEAGHAGCPVSGCLHWGLKRDEAYLDPMLLLDQGPVRLLPRYGGGRADAGIDPGLAMAAGPLAAGLLAMLPVLHRRRGLRPDRGLRLAPVLYAHLAKRWGQRIQGGCIALCGAGVRRGDELGGRPP